MRPKSSIKPLELVVSAIHCLREKKGSSPQNILRYLVRKYNVDTEILKPHIQTGLRRGLNFGMLTQQSGLFRLNDILSPPANLPAGNPEMTNTERNSEGTNPQKTAEETNSQRSPPNKGNRPIKKRAVGRYNGKNRRQVCIQKNKKKARKYKEKKKRTVRSTRRSQNELRRRKQKQRKNGKGKTQKQKIERGKKIKRPENQLAAGAEDQKEKAKESKEETKPNAKT